MHYYTVARRSLPHNVRAAVAAHGEHSGDKITVSALILDVITRNGWDPRVISVDECHEMCGYQAAAARVDAAEFGRKCPERKETARM